MNVRRHRIATSARVAAAPAQVYAILADYHEARRRILPDNVTSLVVDRGGVGAGTIVRFQMRVAGRRREFRAAVTEPQPGRVLAETNLEGRMAVTTFTVDADRDGASEVTIATELAVRRGPLGAIERFATGRVLGAIHAQGLERLAAVVREDAERAVS